MVAGLFAHFPVRLKEMKNPSHLQATFSKVQRFLMNYAILLPKLRLLCNQ